ncbi:MAG: hypothetical protein ABIF71_05310 [Planctomycetota bacterium]
MIEINLLPEELRVHEQTVTGTRIVLFAGVPVLVVLIFFWAWLHFAVLKRVQSELATLADQEKKLAVEAQAVLELEAAVNEMENRQNTVVQLRNLRKLDWVRKLMDLTAAVNGTQGWLTRIEVKLAGGVGTMNIGCAVIGKDRTQLVMNIRDFLNSLGYERGQRTAGQNAFWKDFIARTPEEYYRGLDIIKVVEDYEVTEFTMRLEILTEVANNISF